MFIKKVFKRLLAKYRVPHYFDGVVGHFLGGWCQGADRVDLYLQNQFWLSQPCQTYRPDLKSLMKNTQCGFIIPLDGATLPICCLYRAEVECTLKFYQGDKCIAHSRTKINPQQWVESVEVYHGANIKPLVDYIEKSAFWDQAFYLHQCKDNEVTHPNPIIDFLLKGAPLEKSPCRHFDSHQYLAMTPEVKEKQFNPLVHYLAFGVKEDLQASPSLPLKKTECDYLHSSVEQNAFPDDKKIASVNFEQSTDSVFSLEQYRYWVTGEMLSHNKAQSLVSKMSYQPLISILVPVYNPQPSLLKQCIESVRRQSYKHWQLCLADDASTNPKIKKILQYYCQIDSRIEAVFRKKNGHISAASNSGLELVKGEWTALLDHDDELAPHALFHIVKTLNNNPDATLIYTDEDKIDINGAHSEAHYKPGWDLDLLYSRNYVSHLGVYKTEIIRRVGGFRLGFEGSQDYDLLLRYSREIEHANIVHIPKILYHWRIIKGSTSTGTDAKSYSSEAGVKALTDHFKALGKKYHIQHKNNNNYKIINKI